MRVALELTALELDNGGTARAIEQFLPKLRADRRLDLIELSHPGEAPRGKLGVLARGLSRELIYAQRGMAKSVALARAELLHCMSPIVPSKVDVPLVITLYDAIGWDHPEWLTRANVTQLTKMLPRAIEKNHATIVTSSEYSRARIADSLDLPPDRIVSIPLGLDPRFNADASSADPSLLANLGLTSPFVLTVGTLQPRKNVEAAIAAFERLEDRDGLKLAIAGARGWRDNELLALIAASPAANDIHALGKVTDDELLALYRGAECFVFPSRYEGFGFPPLEAMACGTAVISTTNTSLAEAVGDAAIEIDPDDPEGIAAALASLLGSESRQEQLVALGKQQAAKFPWEAARDQLVDLYAELIARS